MYHAVDKAISVRQSNRNMVRLLYFLFNYIFLTFSPAVMVVSKEFSVQSHAEKNIAVTPLLFLKSFQFFKLPFCLRYALFLCFLLEIMSYTIWTLALFSCVGMFQESQEMKFKPQIMCNLISVKCYNLSTPMIN